VAVRVRCQQCSKFCQVQSEHLGAKVRCGHCAAVFVAVEEPAAVASSGLLGGLKGMVRSLTTPYADLDPADNTDPDFGLELDVEPPTVNQAPGTINDKIGVRMDIGDATTTGRVRSRNEDSHGIQHLAWANGDQHHEMAAIVVADGMGGYEAGDRASALVVQQVLAGLAEAFGKAPAAGVKPTQTAETITRLITIANDVVLEQSQRDPTCKGMGATAAVVVVRDADVCIGHVGDCRVYHFTGGQVKQVTRDQTLVARLVEIGALSPEEALNHPQRNEVTQAIGKHTEIQPTSQQLKLASGDWLIVACDGLHAHVDIAALAAALASSPASAATLAQHLVDLANEGGGSDNCTVVALRCW